MKVGIKRPSPALFIAVIALVVALTGSAAYAALAPKSVGPRQLKTKAVTGAKVANDAVTSAKVAKNSLVGSDFNISQMGTVPAATSAKQAANATTVGAGYTANCKSGTILIRGTCYDSAPRGPILGVKAAADACASSGGYLPTPMEAQSIRQAINLGDGSGSNAVFTDSYTANTVGINFGVTVVSNTGANFVQNNASIESPPIASYHYVCAYRLVQ